MKLTCLGFDFVSSLPSSGDNRWHPANPCNTAVCSFFLNCKMLHSDLIFRERHLTWCGFLFRFLVSALLKTWWVTSKLSKPTGDRRGEVREPRPAPQAQPGQHSTQTVPSSWGRRAENIQLCLLCHWAKQHIHTLTPVYVQTQRVFFPVYQRHLKGEKNVPQKPNTLFTTQPGFAPKYTEDGPAYFRVRFFFFFCFLWFSSLDKCIYGAQLHKDACQLGDRKPWMRQQKNNGKGTRSLLF